jgi:hypothetical protein
MVVLTFDGGRAFDGLRAKGTIQNLPLVVG